MPKENPQIDYYAIKKETETYLARLERIGVDVSELKKDIDEINNEIEQAKQSSSFNIKVFDNCSNKIKQLKEKIIKDWGPFFEIDRMASALKLDIEDVKKMNYQDAYNILKDLLNSLLNAPMDDYQTQGPIIELAYQVVYGFLKLEAYYNLNGSITKEIQKNPVHTSYIADLINRDIETIAATGDADFLKKQYEVERQGFDNSLLIDKELIRLIAIKSNDIIFAKRKEYMKQLQEQYLKCQKDLEQKRKDTAKSEENYTESKKEKNQYLIAVLKRIALIASEVIVLGGISTGIFKWIREDGKNYYSETTTYDSTTNESNVEKTYQMKGGDSSYVIIYELGPWEEYKDYYRRDIKKIYAKPEEGKELSSYINNHIEVKTREDTGVSSTKPDDFDRSEPAYKVVSVQFGEDFRYMDFANTMACFLFLGFIPLACLSGVFLSIDEITKEKRRPFKENLIGLKNATNKNKWHKEILKNNTQDLKTLIKQCRTLLEEIEKSPDKDLINKELLEEKPKGLVKF